MGFADETTETLLIVRGNLLRGLDLVDQHVCAGTFHSVSEKGAVPPAESGQITLALLVGVDEELAYREAR